VSQTSNITVNVNDVDEAGMLSVSVQKTDVDCKGMTTGNIDLTVSGGSQTYTYIWSNNAMTEDLSNLAAGNYSATISDSEGLEESISVTIDEPTNELSASLSSSPAACSGCMTGSIDLSISGGTPNYSYAWSNTNETEDLINVIPGNYEVTITDNNGCSLVKDTLVQGPTIWSGTSITFSKADNADPAMEANQDRISDLVWLTRNNNNGAIYNAKTETSAVASSPAGTEWAVGTTADSNLSFDSFRELGKPKDQLNRNLVLRLVEENILIDLKFTAWPTGGGGSNGGSSGGFSYDRSTPN